MNKAITQPEICMHEVVEKVQKVRSQRTRNFAEAQGLPIGYKETVHFATDAPNDIIEAITHKLEEIKAQPKYHRINGLLQPAVLIDYTKLSIDRPIYLGNSLDYSYAIPVVLVTKTHGQPEQIWDTYLFLTNDENQIITDRLQFENWASTNFENIQTTRNLFIYPHGNPVILEE